MSDNARNLVDRTGFAAQLEDVRSVLVVDDDPIQRLMCKDCLEREKFEVREAGDADAAMREMRAAVPDVVLLDVMMPGRDGFSVCEEMRNDPDLKHIPVIMMTGSDDAQAVHRSFGVEANDFVAKPVFWALLPYRVNFVIRAQRRERELRKAMTAARAADIAKSQFLAAVSHELRTPLNAIIGFSEMIAARSAGGSIDRRYVEYASYIQSSGEALLGIVGDILDLTRLESGMLTLSIGSFDAVRMVEGVQRTMQSQIAGAKHDLSVKIGAFTQPIRGDERRIRQILTKLFSNAIRFTPTGGRIRLIVEQPSDGGIIMTVSDTGIGMGPDDIIVALQPFRQVDGDLSRKYEGTGLGLPICNALVKMHGGSLEIKSAPSQGTTVRVWLPAAPGTGANALPPG